MIDEIGQIRPVPPAEKLQPSEVPTMSTAHGTAYDVLCDPIK